jgi:hypothetical protein
VHGEQDIAVESVGPVLFGAEGARPGPAAAALLQHPVRHWRGAGRRLNAGADEMFSRLAVKGLSARRNVYGVLARREQRTLHRTLNTAITSVVKGLLCSL